MNMTSRCQKTARFFHDYTGISLYFFHSDTCTTVRSKICSTLRDLHILEVLISRLKITCSLANDFKDSFTGSWETPRPLQLIL